MESESDNNENLLSGKEERTLVGSVKTFYLGNDDDVVKIVKSGTKDDMQSILAVFGPIVVFGLVKSPIIVLLSIISIIQVEQFCDGFESDDGCDYCISDYTVASQVVLLLFSILFQSLDFFFDWKELNVYKQTSYFGVADMKQLRLDMNMVNLCLDGCSFFVMLFDALIYPSFLTTMALAVVMLFWPITLFVTIKQVIVGCEWVNGFLKLLKVLGIIFIMTFPIFLGIILSMKQDCYNGVCGLTGDIFTSDECAFVDPGCFESCTID